MQRQVYEYHPVFGYRFIPGLKARIEHEAGGYLMRINQAGFRCEREVQAARTPGRSRVLLFGDSFSAGDGVSNKQRYGDLLEELVPNVEVFNFALSGSGTDQQYLIHREHAPGIEHDLVVIAVLVENIRRVAARYRQYATLDGQELVLAKPYFELGADGELTLRHVPVPKEPVPEASLGEERDEVDRGGRFEWLRSTVNRLGPTVKDLAQRVSRYQPLPHYDSPDHDDWRLLRAILSRWIAECRATVVLFPLPVYQYVEDSASPDGYRARFEELARDTGATLHDPLPDLRSFPLAERRSFRFEVDCHPTPKAHRILAESLAPTVRALLAKSEARS